MTRIVTAVFIITSLLVSAIGPAGARAEIPMISFSVISDIHVQWWHKTSHRKFANALRDLHEINPHADALVINGDLTNGLPADYAKLKEIWQNNPHPNHAFFTIGNHEYYRAWVDESGAWNPAKFPNGETQLASINRFLAFSGEKQVYYEKVVKGYHFLFLGSEEYRQTRPENLEDAYLSAEQLRWLQAALAKSAQSGKPIFLFLHQPLPNTVAGTSYCCGINRSVVQHEELQKILSAYPQVIYFSGHTHWSLKHPQTLLRHTFTMVNSSSVIQLWGDDNHGGEKTLPVEESEGLYVEVFHDKVRIRGRDFYRKSWIKEADFTVPMQDKNPAGSAAPAD